MIKQVSMMKRHPDLTMEQFVALYEARHAEFGRYLFRNASRFVRRYVQPMRNPLTGETKELDFDVVMEIWWDDAETMAEALKAIATCGFTDRIRESGAELFASSDNPAFTVTEYDTELDPATAKPLFAG